MDKLYRSKIDWWVGVILAGAIVAMLGTGVALLVAPPPDASQVKWIALLTVLFAAFTASLPFSTSDTITSTDLLVRAAFFRWRVPLDQIIEVYPTHNPLSSPALSLDRLRINCKRPSGKTWWVMISPKDKEQFLDDLAKAAGLEKDGDRLVRRN
jgi:hypothetical protein